MNPPALNPAAPITSPFDRIRHVDDAGEFWLAREMQPFLAYAEWRNTEKIVRKAMAACRNNGQGVEDHFVRTHKMVEIGSEARREVKDYRLTRYAAYLLAMNCDPEKPEVAAAQHYFAVQTRTAELAAVAAPPAPAISGDPLDLMLAINAQVGAAIRGVLEAKAEARAATAGLAEVRAEVSALAARSESHLSLRDYLRARRIRLDDGQAKAFGGMIAADCKAAGDAVRKHYDGRSGFSFNVYPVSALDRWEGRLRAASESGRLTLFA